MTRPRRARLFLFLLLLAYWALSLRHLAVAPPIYEDEPWQASTGWKLAAEGVFGSDMFAGFYGMERRYYAFMPIHPLLLAGVFKAAGLGLFQARYETVALGALLLALTFALGRRLAGPGAGAIAAALMLLVRFTALSPSQWTGVVLLDMARIARYDMAAAAFGLAALLAYTRARPGLAGLLAALAGLSHLHGLFWLGALGILAAWDRIGRRGALLLALGFGAPWLLYGLYVLGGLPDWQGQTREYAPRFGLLDPAWYLDNLLNEWRRYHPGRPFPLRPGWWAVVCAWPAALLGLARRARERRARALLVPALLLPAAFALLIQSKLTNYLIALLPEGALVVAWGAAGLWAWAGRARRGGWLRGGLAALGLLIAAEGAASLRAADARARATTPYGQFITQVRAAIPDGARVLGLQNYWLGLHDLDYRAWPVPLWQADPLHLSPPLPLEEALDNLAPDVILIDPRMRAFFQEAAPGGRHPAQAWMEARGYALRAVVDDTTYGRMEIYDALD